MNFFSVIKVPNLIPSSWEQLDVQDAPIKAAICCYELREINAEHGVQGYILRVAYDIKSVEHITVLVGILSGKDVIHLVAKVEENSPKAAIND